jgi:hypothetical protein
MRFVMGVGKYTPNDAIGKYIVLETTMYFAFYN